MMNAVGTRRRAPRLPRVALLAALGAAALGCAKNVSFPAVTPAPTGAQHLGKFVWRDLLTNNPEASARFYRELFGWQFEGVSGSKGYSVILHNGRPIAGMLDLREHGRDTNRSQWVSYVSVPDVDSAAEAVRRLGGRIFLAPRDLKGRGRYAIVADRDEAPFALLRAAGGDPPDSLASVGEWLWTELWTHSADSAAAFYAQLLGYTRDTVPGPLGRPYSVLMRDGRPRAGILQYQAQQVRPNWLPYVRVDDVERLVAKVGGLGGRVIFAPRSDVRRGNVAIVADPSGAAITLQRWEPQGSTQRKGGGAR
jgi:uncharacterized protein